MSRLLVNPITAAFDLLAQYRRLVGDNLALAGLAEADMMAVLASLQVDHGLYFTLNRAYRSGKTQFRQFCADQKLAPTLPDRFPGLKQLHAHQEAAVLAIRDGETTIISTGTGSGKTEAFLIPLLDYCLQHPGPGLKALIVYPMNARANDQVRRLESAAAVAPALRVGLYVGSTSNHQREQLQADPPDILVTNHIMLDRLLMRSATRQMLASAGTLRYVVLDEIHTYRGNRATHLTLLLARLKDLIGHALVYIGTSATLQSPQVPGYFVNDTDRRDNFIKPMLGVYQYTLIEPEYCIGSDQMGQGVAPSFGTLLSLIGSGCSRGLAPKGQPTAGRQRALLDGLPLAQNAFGASKVNIGRGDVVKRLVVALLVVVLDEADDCFF